MSNCVHTISACTAVSHKSTKRLANKVSKKLGLVVKSTLIAMIVPSHSGVFGYTCLCILVQRQKEPDSGSVPDSTLYVQSVTSHSSQRKK